MDQCQNFFDDKSPSVCKSSSSSEQQSSPHASTTFEANTESDDRHLELRLGPSMDVSKPKQHEMVRPIPIYPSLDKQRSGNYAKASDNLPLFRGHSDVSMAEKALSSKESAFSTPPLISREQVWQSLQSTSAVLGHGSGPSEDVCDDAAPSLVCRRSTSMQIVMPTNDMSDVAAMPIRRSCSNGIPQGLLSRQSSFGQEALVDESPDPANSRAYQHQQDALELQKKKEMQAHRRLEARKRRRLLIDKQQKKARQNSGGLSTRPSISSGGNALPVRMRSMDCKYELKPLHEAMAAKQMDDEEIKSRWIQAQGKQNRGVSPSPRKDSLIVEGGNTEESCVENDGKGSLKGVIPMECESASSGTKQSQADLTSVQQMIASCDLSSANRHKEEEHVFAQIAKHVDMCDAAKTPHGTCSETESSETKEKELSERESSSQKSSTENYFDHGASANATPMSKPLPYPRTLPRAPSGNIKAQLNLSFPCSPQSPSTVMSRNEGFHARHLASLHDKISTILNEVPSNFTIKRSVGVFSEGKWRIPSEDPAFPPIRRTTSNINELLPEPQCPSKKLETYASFSASQMKFAKMVSNDAASTKFMRSGDELEPRFSGTLHNKSVKDELDSIAADEKPTLGANRSGKAGESPAPHRVSMPVKVKQEQDVMEDKSFESFARDDLSLVAPKMQTGRPIERQLSASLCDLPWVTTTGRGPNGRTINGVMYITGGRSVRLVCRCHGKHMSPAEFVEHAGSNDLSNPLKNIVINPFNQLATTPV